MRQRRRRLASLFRRAAAALPAWVRVLAYALKLLVAILAGIIFPVHAQAGDDWSGRDTGMELGFQGLLALDCVQTYRGSSQDPAHFKEANPLLPEHPSAGQIAAVCAGVGLGHYLVSRWLSPQPRMVWQLGTVAVEGIVVFHNHSVGVGARIAF